jgi:hypothetical protein
MIASANDMRPPAPMPCRARKAASSYMDEAMPHSAEPTTNTAMAKR